MAGLISDYTNGRATTCCVMLILAAPMVRRVSARICLGSGVRASHPCTHLYIAYIAMSLFMCICVSPGTCREKKKSKSQWRTRLCERDQD